MQANKKLESSKITVKLKKKAIVIVFKQYTFLKNL